MNTHQKIRDHLASRTMGNVLVTVEEGRTLLDMMRACEDEGYHLYLWDFSSGLQKAGWNQDKSNINRARLFLETNREFMEGTGGTGEPIGTLLNWLYTPSRMAVDPNTGEPTGKVIPPRSWVPAKSAVAVLDGFDLSNPMIMRHLKHFLDFASGNEISLFFVGPDPKIPKELERDLWSLDASLPTREDLLPILKAHAKESGIDLNGNTEPMLDALSGMTLAEAIQALSKCNARTKREKGEYDLVPAYLEEEKATMLKKGGILEIMNTDVSMEDVGGMEAIKKWFSNRRKAWSLEAREYGLPLPKGVMIFGVQGTGKTFILKALANFMKMRLVKLDPGRLFGQYVGQSEGLVRACIQQIEAFGKCLLFIDEIDKGFAGMRSSGSGDSGVTRRVMGTFLTWMNDKTSPVYVICTANDITQLPPEFLRRGRFDELWFSDLPNEKERKSIFKSQIHLKKRDPKDYDLDALAKATDGWTGAEIEQVYIEALNEAFNLGKEPDTKLILTLIPQSTPLSQLMAEDVEALRSWAKGRARSTSEEVPVKMASVFDRKKK